MPTNKIYNRKDAEQKVKIVNDLLSTEDVKPLYRELCMHAYIIYPCH